MKWLFHVPVLGVLGKLRKATISFVMSVLLSALPHWAVSGRIVVKFGIGVFFENLSGKFIFY